MRYLLDTHILLWWLADDPQLKNKFRKVIADPDVQIYVSSVSVWEVEIKRSLNKLTAPNNLLAMIESNQFIELAMHFSHAEKIKDLPNIHQDPFDRLLIAQSLCENLIFLSEDKIIKKYKMISFLK